MIYGPFCTSDAGAVSAAVRSEQLKVPLDGEAYVFVFESFPPCVELVNYRIYTRKNLCGRLYMSLGYLEKLKKYSVGIFRYLAIGASLVKELEFINKQTYLQSYYIKTKDSHLFYSLTDTPKPLYSTNFYL